MEVEKAPYITDLSTGVIVLDKTLCIKYLNSSAESIFDTSSSAILDQPLINLFYEEPDNSKIFKDCLKKRENFFKVDTLLLLKGNKKILCDYHLHPLSNDRIKGGLLLEIINKEYSSEIRDRLRRQTNQEITNAFIRSLAHEIKNPLSGIRGAAQLLNQKLLDNGLDEYTNLIINQTDRLTSLVDNMLGPNKKPSFKLLNIHLPIENVFTLMKRELLKDKIDFKKLVKSLGYKNYYKVSSANNYDKTLKDLIKSKGPSFLEVIINSGTLEKLTRPKNLLIVKKEFIENL